MYLKTEDGAELVYTGFHAQVGQSLLEEHEELEVAVVKDESVGNGSLCIEETNNELAELIIIELLNISKHILLEFHESREESFRVNERPPFIHAMPSVPITIYMNFEAQLGQPRNYHELYDITILLGLVYPDGISAVLQLMTCAIAEQHASQIWVA